MLFVSFQTRIYRQFRNEINRVRGVLIVSRRTLVKHTSGVLKDAHYIVRVIDGAAAIETQRIDTSELSFSSI